MEKNVGNSPNNPHDLNIHGFPATKPVAKSFDEWNSYAKKRIEEVIQSNSNKQRMKISEFISTPQFAESQINTQAQDAPKVKDKFDDPLPPYNFSRKIDKERPLLNDNGLRRSVDYLQNRKKRREWGFREKILQGYPEYKPFFSNDRRYIVGIVTAGSGVFSGIPSPSNIQYTPTEIYRSAEIGLSGASESPVVPTGLCFIQDETGGLGITLGSDIRYMFHPVVHRSNYANPYIIYDDMHAGSMVIPKADYRQFLRVGDLVVIEVGTNFKYWHAVLGSEPRYWEELWTPKNMVVKTRLVGNSIEYYVDDPSSNFNRKPGQERKPYVDNWGGHERPYQNANLIHPSQRGRDVPPKGIWGNTYSHYPIQEDHPWTTGTPIPVNTGMPYIMMEQFMVDETERFSPTPLVITNSQLRGFPSPSKWQNLQGFKTPRDLGVVSSDLASSELSKIQGWQNPWTSEPGSVYKGMLVQLKNVRFVLPPKKPQLRAKLAAQKKGEGLKKELSKYDRTNRQTNIKGSTDNINKLSFSIQTENINGFKVGDTIVMVSYDSFTSGKPGDRMIGRIVSIEKFEPIGKVSVERLNDKFDMTVEFMVSVGTGTYSDWLLFKAQTLQDVNRVISSSVSSASSMEELVNDLNSIYEYLKDGVSIDQIQVQLSGRIAKNAKSIAELELLNFHKHGIDSRGFYFQQNNFFINEWIDKGDNIGEVLVDIGMAILFTVVDSYTFPGFSSTVYALLSDALDVEDWDDEVDGDRNNYLQYELVNLESPFPKSVDEEDGGYWWANPNIPLTNARSHYKDWQSSNNNLLGINENITDRSQWTQRISSTKLSKLGVLGIPERRVKDLGMMYSSSYAPFAEEWKPSTMVNGQLVMNKFEPIPSGSYFIGNRTYYVVDEHNVVVPIRINSNTEIARFEVPIPTGPVDITGIAWQYSLGKPGLEWEREAYMMQIWPRFASDISKRFVTKEEERRKKEEERKQGGPTPPTPPVRLPELTLDIGDAGNPARLNCDSVREFLDAQNKLNQELRDALNWPVSRTSGEVNVHKDPITGIERTLPSDPTKANELVNSLKDYPCKGMKIGEEREVLITSSSFPGVTRRFFFKVGPNGECNCVMYQGGTTTTVTNVTQTGTTGGRAPVTSGGGNPPMGGIIG